MSFFKLRRMLPLPLAVTRFILLVLITLTITTTWIPTAVGQISFFSESTANKSVQTPWWDLNKARRCGRLVCSTVYLSGKDHFTVALEVGTNEDEAMSALEVERRAKLIEETVATIFQQTVNSKKIQLNSTAAETSQDIPENDWKYLLFDDDKALHPLVPKIEVGTKNEQMVVYVPVQPELGLPQQTIVTVTEADSLNDGDSIPVLAQEWRDIIRQSLSESLWGYELDAKYPLTRLLIMMAIATGTLISIWAISLSKRLLKAPEQKCSLQLHELQQSLAVNPESRCSQRKASKSTPIENSPVLFDHPITTDSQLTLAEQKAEAHLRQGIISHLLDAIAEVQQAFWAELRRVFKKSTAQAQQAPSTQLPTLLRNLPKVSLQWQMRLKQQRTLIHFLLRLLFWGQILILLWGIGLIAGVYPANRNYASFFQGQALWLPLLWMLLSLADKITNFLIDYYLNQWAKDAQSANPTSQRYTLRVSTYSPALKGAGTLMFSVLGIYLTVQLLGINSQVIASAGIAAALVAFLSRNLLEDMLNGALILWTDRYAIGDVIKVGVGEPVGLVEDMNLYITQVRTLDGRLLTIPNGKVGIVENLTKEWSRADFQVEIAYNADVKLALEVVGQVAQQMQNDPQWQDKIIESASVLGVEQVSHAGTKIRVLIKTQALEKWTVEREFRLRVKQAFDEANIAIGVPQQEIWHHNASPLGNTNGMSNTEQKSSSGAEESPIAEENS